MNKNLEIRNTYLKDVRMLYNLNFIVGKYVNSVFFDGEIPMISIKDIPASLVKKYNLKIGEITPFSNKLIVK